MKTFLTRTLTSLIAASAAALAQDAKLPPPTPAPPEPDLEEIQAQAEQQAEMATDQVNQALRQAKRVRAQAGRSFVFAQADDESDEPSDVFVKPVVPRGPRAIMTKRGWSAPTKALVIRTGTTDDKTQSNLEEDLSVMARILQKATRSDAGDDEDLVQASGISLWFAPGGDSPRSLYLEGYGALFLLNVRFPLLPPPTQADTTKAKTPTNSTWDEARRELYGGNDDLEWTKWLKVRPGHEKAQPYDSDKVERLQRALLESLKNGSNIRNLGPNETITVCVFGGTSNREMAVKTVRLPDAGGEKGARAGGEPRMEEQADVIAVNSSIDALRSGGQPTVMTIRVKKADADAFAKGDLDVDAFAKRAQVTKYAAQGGGWGRTTLF